MGRSGPCTSSCANSTPTFGTRRSSRKCASTVRKVLRGWSRFAISERIATLIGHYLCGHYLCKRIAIFEVREDKSFSRLRQKAGNNHFFLVANEVSLRSRSMQRWHLVAGQDGKHGSGGDATVILLVDSAFSTLLEVIFSIAILFAAVISGSTPNSSSQSSGENRSARFCGLISSFARLLELRKLIPGR